MVSRKPKKDTAAMFARLAGQVEEEPVESPPPDETVQEEEPTPTAESKPSQKQEERSPEVASKTDSKSVVATREAELEQTPRRGRSRGKRSDPNYTQIGAYIPKDLDRAVKRALVDEENLDLSELVAQLLDEWVKRKSS